MCRRDELSLTISLAAQPKCEPGNAMRMLKNVTRHIADSGAELSEEDKQVLLAAKDTAKETIRSNFDQLLAGV